MAKDPKPIAKEITTYTRIETEVKASNDNWGDDYYMTVMKTRNMSRKAQVKYFRKSEDTHLVKNNRGN